MVVKDVLFTTLQKIGFGAFFIKQNTKNSNIDGQKRMKN